MSELTFDTAVEILEIVDVDSLHQNDLKRLEKKAKARWHPDRVSHDNDQQEIDKYTRNFQAIEEAIDLIAAYLAGTLRAGERFQGSRAEPVDPVEIIRNNAERLREELKKHWESVKMKKFKWTVENTVLSDGFEWRELLNADFKEDVARLSLISFVYGCVIMILPIIIGNLIHPVLGGMFALIWMLQALSCLLGFLPLSRFWLPDSVQQLMLKFINFGLSIYNGFSRESEMSNGLVQLLVQLPAILASLVKWVVLWPLTEIAKLILGDKRGGVVKKDTHYYGGMADWYIDELLTVPLGSFSDDQFFDLAHVHAELSDFWKSSFN